MNIWLTTDTHFGHEPMKTEFGRPADYEARILRSISNTVKSDDLLIHLGDFCIGNDEDWHSRFASVIKCRRVLVLGNHDRKSIEWYLKSGWGMVCHQFLLERYGYRLRFSHECFASPGHLNIHGHYHTLEHRSHTPDNGDHCMFMSLEFGGYQPRSLDSLVKTWRHGRYRGFC